MGKISPDSSFVAGLRSEGCSAIVIEEIWKWFDYSERKGVASF